MRCIKCNAIIDQDSHYCHLCGHKADIYTETIINFPSSNESTANFVDKNVKPYTYVISVPKLIVMSLFTFGIFELYWFYRQWKSVNAINNLSHKPIVLWILAIFSPISAYWLFKNFSEVLREGASTKGLESGGLAVIYFILSRFGLGFIPLIPVQKKVNLHWEKEYGEKLDRSGFGPWNWIVLILVLTVIFFAYYSEEETISTNDSLEKSSLVSNTTSLDLLDQELIASSVVNILCPSSISDEESSGGSGIILSEDGVILTNSHIIPQDKDHLFVGEDGCMVVLPDPKTGQASEFYLAEPFVIQGISDDYDLAYMIITDAYFDEETGEYQGTYPRTFPAFDDTTRCTNEDLKLGEFVRIYGYPAISGGYSLTVTDGTVSSFPGEGLIVTSAKISRGNSGGLAVDKNGCMIGVPSLVSSDENESLGIIYSMDLINEFSSEVDKYLE